MLLFNYCHCLKKNTLIFLVCSSRVLWSCWVWKEVWPSTLRLLRHEGSSHWKVLRVLGTRFGHEHNTSWVRTLFPRQIWRMLLCFEIDCNLLMFRIVAEKGKFYWQRRPDKATRRRNQAHVCATDFTRPWPWSRSLALGWGTYFEGWTLRWCHDYHRIRLHSWQTGTTTKFLCFDQIIILIVFVVRFASVLSETVTSRDKRSWCPRTTCRVGNTRWTLLASATRLKSICTRPCCPPSTPPLTPRDFATRPPDPTTSKTIIIIIFYSFLLFIYIAFNGKQWSIFVPLVVSVQILNVWSVIWMFNCTELYTPWLTVRIAL